MARWTTRDIATSVDDKRPMSMSLLGEAEVLQQVRQAGLLRVQEGTHVLAVLVVDGPQIALGGGGPFGRRRRLAERIIPPGDLVGRHIFRADQHAPGGELDVEALFLPGRNVRELALLARRGWQADHADLTGLARAEHDGRRRARDGAVT